MFETKNGFINIAAAGTHIFNRLKDVLGDDRLNDPRFDSLDGRSENRHELNGYITETTKTDTSENWIEKLNEEGVPSGEINTIDKTFESPQIKHLGMARDMVSSERGATQIVGQPVIMSSSRSEIKLPPPLKGEHTSEILSEYGYSDDEIKAFNQAGAI